MSQTRTVDLTADVDGVTATFSTPDHFAPGSLVIHRNGNRLQPILEYSEDTTQQFTIGGTEAIGTLLEGDTLLVQYELELAVAAAVDPDF